ncbi:hypothetical protein KDK_69400 [Dictyobacter kobayashii]|uniref:Uncharacterized protein n=1 Tax=Dictyobacter kobayashii TaxID=2014872 RepID=A0A402AVG7_9CHLR|nr:hypothetical protein KDK_69400 [Dictyobacter kobayashii]
MGAIYSGRLLARYGLLALMIATDASLGPVEMTFKLVLTFAGPAIAGLIDLGAFYMYASANDDLVEENRQSSMNIVDWCTQYGNGAC